MADTPSRDILRTVLTDFIKKLDENPGMSGSEVLQTGRKLLTWKATEAVDGLFSQPPRLMTATLDDGIGQGLTMIHCFAELTGVEIIHLGLMQTSATITAECRRQHPDMLGLTVLQYDTEEILCDHIIPQLPETVQVIVGGPIFKTMTEKTLAAKPYRVLNTIPDFLLFLMDMNVR